MTAAEMTAAEMTLIERLQEKVPGRATVTPAQMEAAEERLKLRLPALLQEIYAKVGNGGFGPGDAGLRPLASALLPGRLYPLCDWGSGIVSALDCTQPDAPVIRIDPNMPKADVPERVPEALHFDRAAEVKQACWVESPSLEQWLTDWLDGQPLFYAAYRGADDEEGDIDDEEEDGEETDG
jgi:hypothetical protein